MTVWNICLKGKTFASGHTRHVGLVGRFVGDIGLVSRHCGLGSVGNGGLGGGNVGWGRFRGHVGRGGRVIGGGFAVACVGIQAYIGSRYV